MIDAARATTADEVNAAVVAAAGRLEGIIGVNRAPLVSIDFNHDSHSSVFDATQVIDGRFVRVLAWYDNEWGFAGRMRDVAAVMGALG